MQMNLKKPWVDEYEEDITTYRLCVGEPPCVYPGES